MKIKEVFSYLEKKYPLYLQEDFDNCGVQCGDKEQELTGIMVCFDPSLEVIEEALEKKANLIISHHPVLRNGLKKIEPVDRIGKILCKAIENKMVIYSMHTNMDSAKGGGNDLFAHKLGLKKCAVLSPKESLYQKIVFFAPSDNSVTIKDALFAIGCGVLGQYDNCCYSVEGSGTFRPLKGSSPFIGQINQVEQVEEERVEMIFPATLQRKVIETLYKVHPYEEPAFDIIKLENVSREAGLGRVGELPFPMEAEQFFAYIKDKLEINHIRYSGEIGRKISRVAVCGGGGSSLVQAALNAGADAYVTGDIRYHDFHLPEDKMIIADIGHFEGEHFIRDIIYTELTENFSNFAVSISQAEKLKIFHI